MKFIQRKKITALLGAALLIMAGVLAGCGNSAEKAEGGKPAAGSPVKIRLASQPTYFHAYVAEKLGYFKDAGLDVEISTFAYGPPIIEGFTSGDLDVGFMGDMPIYSGIANGLDLEIIGSVGASNRNQGIAVRDAANIKQLSDLKGKKVAVPFGSNANIFLYLLLEKGGLKPEDVEIVNLGPADGVTTLINGAIDADVIWEPNLSKAAEKGNGVSILRRADDLKLFVSPVVARKEFAAQHPEEIAKLLGALEKAAQWSAANQDKAVEILHAKTEADPAALKLFLELNDLALPLTQGKIDSLVKGAEDAFKFGLVKKQLDIKKAINTTYLEKAGIK